MIRLVIPQVCRDCGERLLYVESVEEHYRFCPGPIRLEFTEEGIFGTAGDCE